MTTRQRIGRIIITVCSLVLLVAPWHFALSAEPTVKCGPSEQFVCTKTDKECKSHDQCKNSVNDFGNSRCYEDACYYDKEAMEVFDRNKTEAFGFSVQNDIDGLKKPALQIKWPGLEFSDIKDTLDGEGFIHIPYLGEFITALYKYGIALGSIIAVVIIIKCGVGIILSAGGEEKVANYHQIGQVVIGLIIMWGSYAFLYTISPKLVEFKPLRIQYITPIVVEHEDEAVEGVASANLVEPKGKNITYGTGVLVAAELMNDLQLVADQLATKKISLYIASGVRTVEKQKALIAKNCTNPPGSATCAPKKPSGVPTCILKDNDPKNCPHTTGRAVDVWGKMNGKQCVMQAQCLSNPDSDPCRKDLCQAELIKAMREIGKFCNIRIEAWHFEKPGMSRNCT